MKTPPFLTAFALLFWGYESGTLLPAILIAVILEGSRRVSIRWAFSQADFARIVDLVTVIFIGMLAFFLVTTRSLSAVVTAIQWLPAALFPLIFAATFSVDQRVHVGALSLIARKGKLSERAPEMTMNLSWSYFALCLLAAGSANHRGPMFFPAMFLLVAWALYSVRAKGYSLLLWGGLLLLVGALGYAGQAGLHGLQLRLEQATVEWFSRSMGREADPYRGSTAMGEIGALKPSVRILFRVKAGAGSTFPLLLREAAYNSFHRSKWFAVKAGFSRVQTKEEGGSWDLAPGAWAGNDVKNLRVSIFLNRGEGLLKLPEGAFRIEEMPVDALFLNRYGAVKVTGGPKVLEYAVAHLPGLGADAPPGDSDLFIPKNERPHIEAIAGELGLTEQSPEGAVDSITQFFQIGFTYSLILTPPPEEASPLVDFLTRSRSGHCEYYASATVMLLRAAGIPARYATGYSVHEYSPGEGEYRVRERDAHSWTLAFLSGAWRNVDTTPPADDGWDSSAFSNLTDTASFIFYRFSKWWWADDRGSLSKYGGWLLVPLAGFLLHRLSRRKRVRRRGREAKAASFKPPAEGGDSPLYRIELAMGGAGFFREPSETLFSWLRRIEEEGGLPGAKVPERLLALHCRHRFDPRGIGQAEMEELQAGVEAWLAGFHLK